MERKIIAKQDKPDIKEWYLSNFNSFAGNLNGNGELPFQKVRKAAISRFAELGFPTIRQEDWKYTNIAPLLQHRFRLPQEQVSVSQSEIDRFNFAGLRQNLLVFINGKFCQEHSRIVSNDSGIIITGLEKALKDRNTLAEKYLSNAPAFENKPFVALNTAFAIDGIFVYVPDGVVLEEPIHVLNISKTSGEEYQSHPRNLFVLGRGSQAKIIESHHHISEGVYFHNAVTEITVGEDCVVDHIKIQDESKKAFRVSDTEVNQQRGSVYNTVGIDLGGEMVRNNVTLNLNGENCETNLYGFYLVAGKQHIDNHTNINHLKPRSNSNEAFKGILADKARGVFSGTIFVEKDAQKTNAFQSNKNLLLSDEAEIDSKPQLKIYADDVKCSHGATIGQLDEESLFYMQQRGISKSEGMAMLRYAFAADVFEKIQIKPVHEFVERMLDDRLKSVDQ